MNQNNNQSQPQTQQQPASQQYYYFNDEISFFDLWAILVRRKKVLASVFSAVIIAAIIYVLLVKPVYESRAIVAIGKVYNSAVTDNGNKSKSGSKVIENTNLLKQELLAEHSGSQKFKIDSIDTNPEDIQDSIRIVIHAESPLKAKESLSGVIEKIKDRHNQKYTEAVSLLEKRKQSLLNDILGYRSQLGELDLVIKNIKGTDAGHLALLMVNRGNVRDTIVEMEKELVYIQSMLSESFATRIVGRQLTKENPVKPKPRLIVVLSIVLGLMLGIFAAFFAEFINRTRNTSAGKQM